MVLRNFIWAATASAMAFTSFCHKDEDYEPRGYELEDTRWELMEAEVHSEVKLGDIKVVTGWTTENPAVYLEFGGWAEGGRLLLVWEEDPGAGAGGQGGALWDGLKGAGQVKYNTQGGYLLLEREGGGMGVFCRFSLEDETLRLSSYGFEDYAEVLDIEMKALQEAMFRAIPTKRKIYQEALLGLRREQDRVKRGDEGVRVDFEREHPPWELQLRKVKEE